MVRFGKIKVNKYCADALTLEFIKSVLSLIQTLKDTFNVCMRHQEADEASILDSLGLTHKIHTEDLDSAIKHLKYDEL